MKKCVNKFLLLIILTFFISCSSDSQIDLMQVVEVDNYKIIAFSKNVDATADYSVNISIIDKGKKITNRDKGNIFIAKGLKNIYLTVQNNNIVITHSYLDKDVFYKNDSCYGYKIIYEIEQ